MVAEVSEVQQKVLQFLCNRGWTSRTEVASGISGRLANTVSVLNRMEALGTIEYADLHEFGRDLLHHVKITKKGLSAIAKQLVQEKQDKTICSDKEDHIKKADMRNKLFHIRDEIDKVLNFFNESIRVDNE